MKLKCKDERRVMVLSSGNTIHRSDGSKCEAALAIGGRKVTKLYSPEKGDFVDIGVTGPDRRIAKSNPFAKKLLAEIFSN